MLCPFCTEDEDAFYKSESDGREKRHLPCIQTLLPIPQRLDRILVRTGQWECEQCGWAKPIYEKQPTWADPTDFIKSITCHCCNDSGAIHPFLVRDFLMPTYIGSDPQIPCRRCKAGLGVSGWDIATKDDCDRIHRAQLNKVSFSPPLEADRDDISASISSLAANKSIKKVAP